DDYEWGWHNKGFTLSELGRIEKALECYNRALEINPNYKAAQNNRQRCLKLLNLRKREESLSSAKTEPINEKSNKKKRRKTVKKKS
ncbi:MAG: tetratricopeptide repeat protein, partial [Thermoplasmata archaeon]|nr:tetratricopeptide repeat protein [Thermoplasmata archaeon]